MITAKTVLSMIKGHSNQVDCVEFSSRVDDLCLCTITLRDKNNHEPTLECDEVIELCNSFIYKCHALLLPGKNKYSLTLMFPVKI